MKELGKALVGPTKTFDDKVIKTNHQAYKSSEKFKKTSAKRGKKRNKNQKMWLRKQKSLWYFKLNGDSPWKKWSTGGSKT